MVSRIAPLDLTAVIKTPENIEFEYRLAGPFRRFPALLLDWFIQWMLIAAFYITILVVASYFFGNVFQSLFGEFAIFIAIVIDFLMMFFYGAVFEAWWNGQTPGKWTCKIRVISADGRPINGYQATIRNLLRTADLAPMLSIEMISSDFPPAYRIPTFLFAFICMVLTKRFQRIGDLAAGTMVIVNEASWIPGNIKLDDPRIPSLASFIPPSFRLTPSLAKTIAFYIERRARMTVGRRIELSRHLADPLIAKFGFRDDTSPDLMLCAIYYRDFVAKDIFALGDSNDGKRVVGSPLSSPVAMASPIENSALVPPLLPPILETTSLSSNSLLVKDANSVESTAGHPLPPSSQSSSPL